MNPGEEGRAAAARRRRQCRALGGKARPSRALLWNPSAWSCTGRDRKAGGSLLDSFLPAVRAWRHVGVSGSFRSQQIGLSIDRGGCHSRLPAGGAAPKASPPAPRPSRSNCVAGQMMSQQVREAGHRPAWLSRSARPDSRRRHRCLPAATAACCPKGHCCQCQIAASRRGSHPCNARRPVHCTSAAVLHCAGGRAARGGQHRRRQLPGHDRVRAARQPGPCAGSAAAPQAAGACGVGRGRLGDARMPAAAPSDSQLSAPPLLLPPCKPCSLSNPPLCCSAPASRLDRPTCCQTSSSCPPTPLCTP